MEEAVTDLVVNTEVRDLLNKVEVGIDGGGMRPRPPSSISAIGVHRFGKVKLDVGLARELGHVRSVGSAGSESHNTSPKSAPRYKCQAKSTCKTFERDISYKENFGESRVCTFF